MSSWLEKFAARPQRAILLLSLALLLAGNWILPLTDRDETRFAEASREMLQRGDFVVPWFNGAWRFDKPVLIYWCQMASYKVFGENDFAARLPSVLFTTATALLLVRWGRKFADAKTAFMAGAMFVAGLHVAIIGRVATADMAMVFFTTLAVWSGWELTRPPINSTPSPRPNGERVGVRGFESKNNRTSSPQPSPPLHGREGETQNSRRKRWWWIFYVTLALGFLAKGPVAWLPLGGLITGRVLRRDSFRLPLNETVVGLSLTVALASLWALPALDQTNWQYLFVGLGEHVIHRSTGVIDGHGFAGMLGFIALLPLYFLTFFVSFFPWSMRFQSETEMFDSFDSLCLRLTGRNIKSQTKWNNLIEKNNSYRDQFQILKVVMMAVASFAFVPSRILRWFGNSKSDCAGWYLLLQAALVFVVFSCVRTKLPHYTMPAFPCIALWLAMQLGREQNSCAWFNRRLAAMSIIILALMLGGFAIARNYLLTENLWREVKASVRLETKIGCFGYTEPSLVWKFRSVTTNLVTLGDVKRAKDFLTNAPPFILVLPTSELTNWPTVGGAQFRVRGLDMVKFKNRDLTAIVRDAKP